MAVLYKDKNIIQKFSIAIAIVFTGIYFVISMYFRYIKFDYEWQGGEWGFLKILICAVWLVMFVWSSSANDTAELIKHIFKFFVCMAVCCALGWYWLGNIYDVSRLDSIMGYGEEIRAFFEIYYDSTEEFIRKTYVDFAKEMLFMTALGGFLCYAKLSGSNNSWLKKHID